jgi:hypothetical protein
MVGMTEKQHEDLEVLVLEAVDVGNLPRKRT